MSKRAKPSNPARTSRSHRSYSPPRRTYTPALRKSVSKDFNLSLGSRQCSVQTANIRGQGITKPDVLYLQKVSPERRRPLRRARGWSKCSSAVTLRSLTQSKGDLRAAEKPTRDELITAWKIGA